MGRQEIAPGADERPAGGIRRSALRLQRRRSPGPPYQPKCLPGADLDEDGHNSEAAGGDDCNDLDAQEFPGNAEITDPHGHDEDCDEWTGYVIPYDPNFLDPRPHRDPGSVTYSQTMADEHTGRFVVHTSPGGVRPCDRPMSAPAGSCPGAWYTPPLYP